MCPLKVVSGTGGMTQVIVPAEQVRDPEFKPQTPVPPSKKKKKKCFLFTFNTFPHLLYINFSGEYLNHFHCNT
jgi:hypothetical protein